MKGIFQNAIKNSWFFQAKQGGESGQEEKQAATLDDTSYRLQTFAIMFLALIRISCQILREIHQGTFNLDMPSNDWKRQTKSYISIYWTDRETENIG